MLIGGISLLSAAAAVLLCLWGGGFQSLGWLWMLPVGFAGVFLVLTLAAFLFLWLMCARIRLDVPQEKDSPFYRALADLYISAIRKLLRIRIETQGMEQLPEEGRFLLVCNHCHDSDPVLLLHMFRKSQLAFISKRENSSMFLVGKLMHKLMCQPINRENDREALKTIVKCIQMIKADQVSVAVFPEGYIHDDRKLHTFRHGVFKIAQKAQVPIVVCTLHNTKYVFQNIIRFKPSHIKLHLLTVIPPEEHTHMTTVELGSRIYQMMAQDLGPENVYTEEACAEQST